jgi:hypothetical protein
MEINSKGITPSTLKEYLTKWTQKLKEAYGQDFFIKPEGKIDNLAAGSSGVAMDFESILLYIAKNMNPYTAEDNFQDNLYAYINMHRRQATHTIVQRTIYGTPSTTILADSLLFENNATKDQFKLMSDCDLDENGYGVGTFRAEESGAIDLPNDAICNILSAPTSVLSISYTSGNLIQIGLEYQSDAEFREEWEQEQSSPSANTEGGIKRALLPYCGGKANNINVRMNRGILKYEDVALHSANIVVNSVYDDQTIANVIGDKILDGLGLEGDIHKIYVDSEGNEEDIYFSRAEDVGVKWYVQIALKEGYSFSTGLVDRVKSAILDNTNTEMGENVVANKAIHYIDKLDEIDYVSSIKVSDDDGLTMADYIDISDVQRAIIEDIDVSI